MADGPEQSDSAATTTIDVQRHADVISIKLSRIDAHNALDLNLLVELRLAISGIATELNSVRRGQTEIPRVVLITSASRRAFSVGADIREMASLDEDGIRRFIERGLALMREIELVPIPVCAIVDGAALGGGLELTLACDAIIATERAVFGLPEVTLGLIPGFGGTRRLVDRIGYAAARKIIMTGSQIGGEDAVKMGLADYIVPRADLEPFVESLVASYRLCGPLALGAVKKTMASGRGGSFDEALRQETEAFVDSFLSEDAREGFAAFFGKREPFFKGK